MACLVTSSSPVPLKTHRVGQRCMLSLSRAQTSSCWSGVVVKRGQLKCRPRSKLRVGHLPKIKRDIAKYCNMHSIREEHSMPVCAQ
ncbi:hypothetical protein TNCV_2075571 [Trichonephila clavipes]|nr:hypothetical protein TNCV_2075571 [Trichonephila clavipes]